MEGIQPLLKSPAESGLFLDFDGTLSEIAPLPEDARPLPGVPGLLERLTRHFGVVAVVSGRRADELFSWLGAGVEIWGVHGTQIVRDGEVTTSPLAAPFAELIDKVKREAREHFDAAAIPGAVFEDKGVMFNLHFRAAEDPVEAERTLDQLAADLVARHGLARARTTYSFELRPPRDFTKAAVILERVREEGLKAAAFVGDDRVDLPAFDALDQLEGDGVQGVRVAVSWAEAPAELIERADVVVEGPQGAVEFLERLVSELEG